MSLLRRLTARRKTLYELPSALLGARCVAWIESRGQIDWIDGEFAVDVGDQCGQSDYMARRAEVGARELKTRLGTYLRKVRQGSTLVVTDRGEPVAELR